MKELHQIKLLQEWTETQREFERNLTQIQTHVTHIDEWKEDRWTVASNEPAMVEKVLTKLPKKFKLPLLEERCKLITRGFDGISRHEKTIQRIIALGKTGRKSPIEKLLTIRKCQFAPKGSNYTTEAPEREINEQSVQLSPSERDEIQSAVDRVKAASNEETLAEEIQNLYHKLKEIQTIHEREIHRIQRVISKLCWQMLDLTQKVNEQLTSAIEKDVQTIKIKKSQIERKIKDMQGKTNQLRQEQIYNINRILSAGIVGSLTWLSGGTPLRIAQGALVGGTVPKGVAEAFAIQQVYPAVMEYFDSLYDLLFNPNIYRGLANNGFMLVIDETKRSN